jgi:Protein of unknown function (DUF548).
VKLAVGWQDEASRGRAEKLARELDLPCVACPDLAAKGPWQQLLLCDSAGLALCATGAKRPGPVRAEFLSGAVAHRRRFGGGTGQLIARACGIRSGLRPTILDATAGLGRDAFVLATLGCRVRMLERSPVVHALLAAGLERARGEPELAQTLQRMTLERADGRVWLQHCPEHCRPDLVYLDPMFPHPEQKSLVKKEMRAFRELVGQDADAAELLAAALQAARYRVVVKRARKAPPIAGRAPSYALEGKSSRYDVYALRALAGS